MANRDITYCNGKGCGLRELCRRYVDGQRIIVKAAIKREESQTRLSYPEREQARRDNGNANRDENQHWWMDHCDEEQRDGFMELTNNRKE